MTDYQRLEKERKTSNVDSDLGVSDSINSNNDNTLFDKKDDFYKAKTEENNTDKSQEKTDFISDNIDEKVKNGEIDDNACEIINDVVIAEDKENAKESNNQEKNEGWLYSFIFLDYVFN